MRSRGSRDKSRPALACIIGALGVDGRDDLLRGDPLQVGAGRREVRVPQLALDQRQRDALVQQLDGVGMAELVVVPTSAQASLGRPLGCADISSGLRAGRRSATATSA